MNVHSTAETDTQKGLGTEENPFLYWGDVLAESVHQALHFFLPSCFITSQDCFRSQVCWSCKACYNVSITESPVWRSCFYLPATAVDLGVVTGCTVL